jgi:hypothetical protein
MLANMIDGWVLWLLLVGIAIAVAVTVVLLVRLPREEDDVGVSERRAEAAWIAGTIERHGGVAPTSLVAEVLDLHQAYLGTPRPPRAAGPPATPMAGAPFAMPPRAPQAVPPPPNYPPPPAATPPAAPPPAARP